MTIIVKSYRQFIKKIGMAALAILLSLGSPFLLNLYAEMVIPLPNDMNFIPFGMAIIGLDKKPKSVSSVKDETQNLFQQRMSMPWSKEAFHDEGPSHWVLLNSYFIDKFEVSNQKYAKFMKTTGYTAPAYWDDPRLNSTKQPVVGVNWYDAKAYCEWEGKRLPTEAEWEHAARGSEGLRYPWGNTFDSSKANYGKNFDSTLPVNSLPEGKSPYGLHHMAGNVFEWVGDWYDPSYYSKGPFSLNPSGPAKPVWLGGTGTYVDRLTVGAKKVIRGGSWIAANHSLTTTYRFWNHPMNNSYGVGLGFRCAQNAPKEVEYEIRAITISAMKKISMEKYQEAEATIDSGLKIDPNNENLLRLRKIIERGNQQS